MPSSDESVCTDLLIEGMESRLRRGRDGVFMVGLDAKDGEAWCWKTIDAKTWEQARQAAPGALVMLLNESSERLVSRANALIRDAQKQDACARAVAHVGLRLVVPKRPGEAGRV